MTLRQHLEDLVEFTLESAFSLSGMLGHSSYLLLVLSMLMRRLVLLRLLVIASALAGISYSSFILTDPVGTFWEILLIAVNIGQLALGAWSDRSTQFTGREAVLRELHFQKLPPRRLRRLLAAGEWTSISQGARLTDQGTPVPSLYYIAEGTASVHYDGVRIGSCGAGTFVGEMTATTGEPAFATVRADGQIEVWQVRADVLRDLVERVPEIGNALEAAVFRTLRSRLLDRNRRDVLEQLA